MSWMGGATSLGEFLDASNATAAAASLGPRPVPLAEGENDASAANTVLHSFNDIKSVTTDNTNVSERGHLSQCRRPEYDDMVLRRQETAEAAQQAARDLAASLQDKNQDKMVEGYGENNPPTPPPGGGGRQHPSHTIISCRRQQQQRAQ
jgi:hypothetical protein